MTDQRSYTYTTLRYVHDVRTGEFLNVGVVVHSSSLGQLEFKTRKTFTRAKHMFPDLDGDAFRASMQSVDRALAAQVRLIADAGLLAAESNAVSIARTALPADDSTLQWSELGSGVTDNLSSARDRLYARMVTRYDAHAARRRTDEDVWRPVREKLDQMEIPIQFEEKVVVGATDTVAFKHAWKNGQWHAYEPLSLDLADADGIKDKARRWRGHLAAVADGAREELNLYFVVGAPQSPALQPAYRNALTILRKADFHPKVFEENQIDELISEIEDEVRAHAQDTTTRKRPFPLA
jgi:hypothetical protein